MQQSLIFLLTDEFFIPILLCHRLYISIVSVDFFFLQVVHFFLEMFTPILAVFLFSFVQFLGLLSKDLDCRVMSCFLNLIWILFRSKPYYVVSLYFICILLLFLSLQDKLCNCKYIITLSKYQSVVILFRAIEVTLFFMLVEI